MSMRSLSIDNVYFPDRKSVVRSDVHLTKIVDQAKSINLEKVSFEGEDFQPKTRIIQKQKIYLWMRLYLKEEIDIKPETKISVLYLDGQEMIETYFMFFGKKGLERDKQGEIINFNPEDDRKILCLLVDAEKIDINNADIPYMKTLFTLGKFYTPQYIKKYDFSFVLDDGKQIEFYDIEF